MTGGPRCPYLNPSASRIVPRNFSAATYKLAAGSVYKVERVESPQKATSRHRRALTRADGETSAVWTGPQTKLRSRVQQSAPTSSAYQLTLLIVS